MSDGQHYATMNDLAAVTGLAAPVYTVGPAASGAVFTTVQEAVTEAKDDIDAGTITKALVLVYPGTYLEDVKVLCSGIYVAALGGPGDVVIRSLTWSDATSASITAFNASGTFTDLADGTYTFPALEGGVVGVTLSRDAAAAAYGSAAAEGSLRLLGFDAAAGTFLNTKFIVQDCRILKANGAAAGTGGILGCYGNALEVRDTLITGGCLFEQYAVKQFYNVQMLGTGVLDETYNSAGTIPATAYAAMLLYNCDIAGEIELNGDVADMVVRKGYLGSIDNNCTAAGSASTIEGCHIAGAIDNANLNATMTITGGSTEVAVTGAGAASVTISTQKIASDLVPLTDNSAEIGSSSKRLADVHATQLTARGNSGDTKKSVIASDGILVTGTNHAIMPAAAAADTAGYSESVVGGAGGVAVAAAGGVGGTAALTGGAGGAGVGAFAAGAGADANLTAGAAGADGGGGGGGANGGNVVVAAGNASGAGTDGDVKIGLTDTTKIETGATIQPDLDNTDYLGTSGKRWAGIHAVGLDARADAISTNYAQLRATGLTIAGGNFTTTVAKEAGDTAGRAVSNTSGAGGNSAAAAGGVGGANTLAAGVGGDGGAAQPAGAGGDVNVTAGAAGADGGGGGAAGGAVDIDAGAGTGAAAGGAIELTAGAAPGAGAGGAVQLTGGTSVGGTAGKVQLQPTGAGTTEIGNAASNPACSFLGTGAVAVGGALAVTGALTGPMKITPTAVTPYNVAAADNRSVIWVDATAGVKVVQLPLATGTGLVITASKADAGANAVNVTPQAGEDISGAGAGVAHALAAKFNKVTVVDVAAGQWLIIA